MTPPAEETLLLAPFDVPMAADAAALDQVPEVWSMRLSLLGALLAVPALWLLLEPSLAAHSAVHVASFAAYGAGLISMFLASALFHSHAGRERKFSKCLDYGAIGLMVAGNFTPYCTLVLRTPGSYRILELVWALALGALVLRVTRTDLSKWAFVAIFMVMGCLGFLIAPALWRTLGHAGVLLTVLGGAIYTAGTMFFNRFEGYVEPPGFGPHDVWHVFILAAAGTHWLVLYLYMLPGR
ncbi:MAG TPA: hemolysin III family protein [Elusimicrobiota bacterium]|nr:hemolysin III family protein [Elusimicrobiota bacterium]